MRKWKRVIFLLAVVAAGLLVSAVTAVPCVQAQNKTGGAGELATLRKIMKSSQYQQFKNIADQHFNESQRGIIQVAVQNYLSGVLPDGPIYPSLVNMLVSIGEVMLLLFGHNAIGVNLALLVCTLIAFVILVFVDGAIGLVSGIVLPFTIFKAIISSGAFLYTFGALGCILAVVALIAVGWLLAIVAAPVLMIADFTLDFTDTMKWVYKSLNPSM